MDGQQSGLVNKAVRIVESRFGMNKKQRGKEQSELCLSMDSHGTYATRSTFTAAPLFEGSSQTLGRSDMKEFVAGLSPSAWFHYLRRRHSPAAAAHNPVIAPGEGSGTELMAILTGLSNPVIRDALTVAPEVV